MPMQDAGIDANSYAMTENPPKMLKPISKYRVPNKESTVLGKSRWWLAGHSTTPEAGKR